MKRDLVGNLRCRLPAETAFAGPSAHSAHPLSSFRGREFGKKGTGESGDAVSGPDTCDSHCVWCWGDVMSVVRGDYCTDTLWAFTSGSPAKAHGLRDPVVAGSTTSSHCRNW